MSICAANVQYIGLSFIYFKPPSLALGNEVVTQLALVYRPWCLLSNRLASVSLPPRGPLYRCGGIVTFQVI